MRVEPTKLLHVDDVAQRLVSDINFVPLQSAEKPLLEFNFKISSLIALFVHTGEITYSHVSYTFFYIRVKR